MEDEDVVLPKLGESIYNAVVVKWLKSVGDTVEEDESICEVSTDKVNSELPSSSKGVIKEIRVQEGSECAVGDILCVIERANKEKASFCLQLL